MIPRRAFERRSRSWIYLKAAVAAGVMLAFGFHPSSARAATSSPEQEVLRIAKTLKPIPDDEWKRIAGDRISQKYEISKGDTLYDVSKRLFGDAKYWPKIWALNNGHILNPHVIFPGNTINFLPGTGTSLPGVSVETAENDQTPSQTASDADLQAGHPPRSQQWKMLPPQDWENVELQVPPEVDPLGFDTRSKVTKPLHLGYDLPLMTTSTKLQPLGLIFADEKGSEFISLYDLIFIHPQGDLQVGQTYSIIDEPQQLQNQATTRVGWAYPLVGKVKLLDQRDGMFIGEVISASHPFTRGANIAPLQPHVDAMDPIPGPSAMDGVVLLDERYSTSTVAQHNFVFVDRGSDDGVTPGMVFRQYQHDDPNDDKQITRANIIIAANLMVVQTSPKFSTCLVLDSDAPFSEGASVTLLTDVSDLLAGPDPARTRLERLGTGSPDDLDSLDNGEGLNGNEKRELRQLEKWKGNEQPAPGASGGPVPPPPGQEIPPPTPTEIPAPTEAPATTPEAAPPPPASTEAPPTAPAPDNNPTPPPASTTEAPPPPPADTGAPSTQAPSDQALPPPPADEPIPAAPSGDSGTSGAASTPSDSAPPSMPADVPPPPPPAQ